MAQHVGSEHRTPVGQQYINILYNVYEHFILLIIKVFFSPGDGSSGLYGDLLDDLCVLQVGVFSLALRDVEL